MAVSGGNCFLCGKTAGKTAIKNHALKEHNSGDERCYLLKAESPYNKSFWLLFSVSLDASASSVDNFLRSIWCECCGHMSGFFMEGAEFGKTRKISQLDVGDILMYEYDFGSTTEISITVLAEIARPKQREKVQLLARNEPPKDACEVCSAPATCIHAWECNFLCDKCAEKAEDEGALMPLVNSPRCGVCGYCGESDIWVFDPDKPFPQPQKKRKSRGVWMPPD